MEKYGVSFKEMNLRQKWEHIWTYYRYPILAVIIGIVVIGTIGKTILCSPPDNVVDVFISGKIETDDTTQQMIDKLTKEKRIGVTIVPADFKNDSLTRNTVLQKIILMLSTKSLEIIGLPKEQYEHFVLVYGTDMFMPLEEIPELSDLLKVNKSHLYYNDRKKDAEGNIVQDEKHVYGIYFDNLSGLKGVKQQEEMVLGIVYAPRDKEKAMAVYAYLLGDKDKIIDLNKK